MTWANRRCLSVKLDECTTTFTLYAFGYGDINQHKFGIEVNLAGDNFAPAKMQGK
jgi:hypothetical protein